MKRLLLSVTLAATALASQQFDMDALRHLMAEDFFGELSEEEPHVWNYGKLGKDWTYHETCMSGARQSPIDLSESFVTPAPDMKIQGTGFQNFPKKQLVQKYGAACMGVAGSGLIELTLGDGSQAEYEPVYAHFKSPSEHCFDKVRRDLEMQVFFRRPGEDSISAALAVFWDTSAITEKSPKSCPFINNIHADEAFNKPAGERTQIYDINFKSILGGFDMRNYYSYEGSLTNPPCTEGVQWTVIVPPRPLSQEQADLFRSLIKDDPKFGKDEGFNVRAPQPLGDRTVYLRQSSALEPFTLMGSVSLLTAIATVLMF